MMSLATPAEISAYLYAAAAQRITRSQAGAGTALELKDFRERMLLAETDAERQAIARRWLCCTRVQRSAAPPVTFPNKDI